MVSLHLFVIEGDAKASSIRTTVESWGVPVNWTQVDDPHQMMKYFSQSPHDDNNIIVGPEDKPRLPVPSTGEVLFFDDFVSSFHFKNTIIINMCLAGSPMLAHRFIGQGARAYLWSSYGLPGQYYLQLCPAFPQFLSSRGTKRRRSTPKSLSPIPFRTFA